MNKHEQTVIGKIICEKYDICILTKYTYENCKSALLPHKIDDIPTKIYKNVELLNINGLGIGQIHFITEKGEYILVPWSMIVWMLPVEDGSLDKETSYVKETSKDLNDWITKCSEN